MSNWLSNRLTPSKIKEARWVEFSTVLEHVWEEFFDPAMSRLERLRSAYTADDADLIKKIREMGDYFSFDRPRYEDRPVSLAWRRLELEYKDMELILSSVFRRHYSNLPVTWFPIFAPIDVPYGTEFQVAEGPWPERKNVPPDGWFLTSRGRLGTDYGYLLSLGLTKQTFLEKALPLLMRTKPLHIVYDGPLWYIWFDLEFNAAFPTDLLWWERDCGLYELQFSVLGSRFDYTPADVRYLDIQSALCTWERLNDCEIPFIPLSEQTWHLDYYLPEILGHDWLPTDILLAGHESENNPLILAAGIHEDKISFNIGSFNSNFTKYSDNFSKTSLQPVKPGFYGEIHATIPVLYQLQDWRLDRGISVVPDGWLTDPVIPGKEGWLSPIVCFIDNGTHFSVSIRRLEAASTRDKPTIYPINFEAQSDALMDVSEAVIDVDADFSVMGCLDRYPRFDDFPADKLPLDMPVGGIYV